MPFTAVVKSMAKVSVNLEYCGIHSFNNVYGSVHDRIRIFSVRILPRNNNLWKTDNGVQVELINVSATDQVFKKGEDMACFQMLPDQSISFQASSSDFKVDVLHPEESIADLSALFSIRIADASRSRFLGTRRVVNSSTCIRHKVLVNGAQSFHLNESWSMGKVDDRRSRYAFKHNCAEGGSEGGVSGGRFRLHHWTLLLLHLSNFHQS